MRKWAVTLLWIVLSSGAARAQDAAAPLGQIGSVEAGDFRALAVTADGGRLLVADGENQQVRVYDFRDPATPTLLTTLDVSGTPTLLAGGERYGLAVVTTDGETDTIEVVAPPLPGMPYSSGSLYISIPKNPHTLALSPDGHWGIAVSEGAYTLMQIDSPAEITSSPPVDGTIIDAALSETSAYLLRDKVLETAPLGSLRAMQAASVLGLDGEPSAVTLNVDTTEGVVVLDGNRLVFFDPASLQKIGEFTVTGDAITGVHFLTKDGAEYLILTQADSGAVTVLNVADPQHVQPLPGAAPLSNPIRALAIFQQYLIVTDGVTISIFSA